MKRLLVMLLASFFLVGIVFAADYTNIGYIDVQKVFTGYKETEKAQKDLEKEEETFKKESGAGIPGKTAIVLDDHFRRVAGRL